MKVMQIKASGKHEITVKPNFPRRIYYKSFDSNITIKVRRLTAFMSDIIEG